VHISRGIPTSNTGMHKRSSRDTNTAWSRPPPVCSSRMVSGIEAAMESTRRRVPRPVQSHPVHVSDPGSPGVPGSTAPQHLMRQCLGRNLRPSPNLFHNKRMNGIDQSSLPSRNTRSSARAMKIPLHAPHMAGSGRWFVGRSIVPAKSDGTTRDGPVLCPSSRLSCCPLTVGHLQHGRLVERQPRRCLHPTPEGKPSPAPRLLSAGGPPG
jgi:hypothetical protein